jgi:hypothetical protein
VTASTVIGGVTYEVSEVITFGKGPLSVFASAPQVGLQWATNDAMSVANDFKTGNTFPAASHCGGTVNNDSSVVVVTPIPPANAKYSLFVSGAGWRAGDRFPDEYYSTSSGLPTLGQLLAASRHDDDYNSGVHRKGAALAAGWPDDAVRGGWYEYWTGQMYFYSTGYFEPDGVYRSTGYFYAGVVYLANGLDYDNVDLPRILPVTVCVAH